LKTVWKLKEIEYSLEYSLETGWRRRIEMRKKRGAEGRDDVEPQEPQEPHLN